MRRPQSSSECTRRAGYERVASGERSASSCSAMRRAIREEIYGEKPPSPARRARLLEEALGHLDRQLELVERRYDELEALRGDLAERRERVVSRLAELRSPAAR